MPLKTLMPTADDYRDLTTKNLRGRVQVSQMIENGEDVLLEGDDLLNVGVEVMLYVIVYDHEDWMQSEDMESYSCYVNRYTRKLTKVSLT